VPTIGAEAPTKIIEVPGLGNVEFPASMDDATISEHIKNTLRAKQPTIAEQYHKFGEEHPIISGALSLIPGLGALAPNAGEVQTGMVKQAGRDAYNILEHAGPVGMAAHLLSEKTGLGDTIRKSTEPSNSSQEFGSYATMATELALPSPAAAGQVAELVPTAEKAGQKFASVMASAHDLPVNIAAPGDIALRARELAASGGSMPKVMRDFLTRATAPDSSPITYKEARDFYSNATRLSADEAQRLTPVMKRQAAMFTQALGKSLEDAAAHVGKLDEYHQAMTEYHTAMRIRSLWQDIKDLATSSAVKATGAGAASAYAVKKLLE